MYRSAAFDESDLDAIMAMIGRAPLGHVVVGGETGLDASPVPLLARRTHDGIALEGHVARANPIWRQAPCDALVILPGPDAYVSPSWYPSKSEHGKVVPTWNYEVVHVHGRLVAHDDAAWTESLVRRLTALHESDLDDPWSPDDAPAGFVDTMLRGIVGVEIEGTRIEAKRKLGQNRTVEDRLGAATGVAGHPTGSSSGIAELMRDVHG